MSTASGKRSVYRHDKMAVDAANLRALDGHPGGRTAVELAEATCSDYATVLTALGQFAADGLVARSRTRVGARIATGRPPTEAA